MTARVMSSAVEIFGHRPTFGRYQPRSGRLFSSSSILTYSAVTSVSTSASTETSTVDRWFAAPIVDAFAASGVDARPAGTPWNYSSRQAEGSARRGQARCSVGAKEAAGPRQGGPAEL